MRLIQLVLVASGLLFAGSLVLPQEGEPAAPEIFYFPWTGPLAGGFVPVTCRASFNGHAAPDNAEAAYALYTAQWSDFRSRDPGSVDADRSLQEHMADLQARASAITAQRRHVQEVLWREYRCTIGEIVETLPNETAASMD